MGKESEDLPQIKYHWGLNNGDPWKMFNLQSSHGFISISFVTLSMQLRDRGTTLLMDPKNRSEITFMTCTFNSPKVFFIFPFAKEGIREEMGKRLITSFPKGSKVSETCLQCCSHFINAASGRVTHTRGCSCPKCYSCPINLLVLACNWSTRSTELHIMAPLWSEVSHSSPPLWPTCMTDGYSRTVYVTEWKKWQAGNLSELTQKQSLPLAESF